jgi:uncharacterized protein YndB with AHSA1/START domain
VAVEESVDIARPPETVWDFVVDPTKDTQWCPKVRSVQPIGASRWKVVHKPVPVRPAVELSVQQLALDPPSRLVIREEDQTSVFTVIYRLERIPAGTRFTQVSEVEWKRVPRVFRGLFTRGVRRDVRGQLKTLKRVLEAR